MSREINPFGLRMPLELRERLEAAARQSARSLNAEIVHRLQESFAGATIGEAGEHELSLKVRSMAEQIARLTGANLEVIRMIEEHEARRAEALVDAVPDSRGTPAKTARRKRSR
ncbi:Arc family DNA-binding protein [Luteimonas composti]|uniref:Arc family DNA-binding protein n=1 Tax=Luteimonas composti TaxID=398257 RepID=UPI00364242E3